MMDIINESYDQREDEVDFIPPYDSGDDRDSEVSEDSSDKTGDEGEDESAQDDHIDIEIEGDFDRLIENIRMSERASLTKDWDFSFDNREAEFRDDLRAASGVGRNRSGRRSFRQSGPTLSLQVRALIGEGNQAYVDGDVPEAMRIMQEVIRIEPRASGAWAVLAQCYEDRGETGRALQLRVMGAHLRRDPEEWERLARHSRDMGLHQQALYCYRKISSLDPSNIDALWDRASLAKETGDLRIARYSLLSILKFIPHDMLVLEELRSILIDLGELTYCVELYEAAFKHHTSLYPNGPPQQQDQDRGSFVNTFNLLHILVLADLYNTLGAYERAIASIRQGVRWLQGRSTQRFWDVLDDDREYDLPPEEAGAVDREGDVQAGFYPLDINARHRLTVARIKMGDIEEGQIHANIVLAQDVLDYAPLFAETADAYFERDMFATASPIYEVLAQYAETSSLYILLQVAACHRLEGNLEEASRVYEHIVNIEPNHLDAKLKLAEVYELLDEPRLALNLVHEVIDARKRRRRAADDASGPEALTSTSLFEEKPLAKSSLGKHKEDSQKLTKVQLRELENERERDVAVGWKRVVDLWPHKSVDIGDGEQRSRVNEWMLEAEKLVDMFRETRNLFMAARNNPFRGMFPARNGKRKETEEEEERMATRLQLDIGEGGWRRKHGFDAGRWQKVDIFRGVSFNDWLRLFVQYALLLSKDNQYDLADEILRHLLLSNAYQSRAAQDTIRLALITCAIANKHFSAAVEHSRRLIVAHQFNNEPLRILFASLASGLRPTDAFISNKLQKHILREIRFADLAVRQPDLLRWNDLMKRFVLAKAQNSKGNEDDDEDEGEDNDVVDYAVVGGVAQGQSTLDKNPDQADILPKIPQKHNPMLVAIHGQICNAAKSYQSAIFYLLHAFDYCPGDPVICLSLAIASIGRAMQRQSDNRHHLIAQAMAFLSKYRDLRRNDPHGLEEIEFNFGRAFHQLGLYTYAVKHYESVLAIAEGRPSEVGLAREAAYNLSLIYVTTGAPSFARELYKRWLSL